MDSTVMIIHNTRPFLCLTSVVLWNTVRAFESLVLLSKEFLLIDSERSNVA